jgi:hypothetical protein
MPPRASPKSRKLFPVLVLFSCLSSIAWTRLEYLQNYVPLTNNSPSRNNHHPSGFSRPKESLALPSRENGYTVRDLPRWLDDYVKEQSLRIFQNSKGRARVLKDSKILRYECNKQCGGVGDRIHGMLTALTLAICSNRTLNIQSNHPDPLENYLVPNLLHWNATQFHSATTPFLINGMNHRSNSNKFMQDPSLLPEAPQTISVRSNTFFRPHEGPCRRDVSGQDFADLPFHMFWTLFRFSDAVDARALELTQLANIPEGHPYVAVHIRTGDQLSFNSSSTNNNNNNDDVRHASPADLQAFSECGRKLRIGLERCVAVVVVVVRRRTASIEIYVASDNSAAKQAMKLKDDHVQTVYDVAIYHNDNDDKPRHNSDPSSSAHLDVWAEFKVLVDATCLVYSRSGFSETADEIGARPRCAVRFDQCEDEDVALALYMLDC